MKTLTAALAAMLAVAAPAAAHVPDDCRPLFAVAGKTVDGTIRKGNEARDIAMDGIERRRVGVHDYGLLADRLFQLLGWQGDAFKQLAAAVECAHERR